MIPATFNHTQWMNYLAMDLLTKQNVLKEDNRKKEEALV